MLVGQTIGSGPYRFEVEEELGSGAMGMVYRAKFHQPSAEPDREPKVRPVALKMIALGLLGNEGAMARFVRESDILKQLRHPNIVRLHATGAWKKTPFIAMEFIDGEPLDRVLARRGRLSWEEVVAYGKQLCAALQYAHEKGIIHRDLKPSNLMVTREGVLKLTDFGIAKDTDVTALTGQNSTIGTAAYMSPEQCKGDKNLTNKSDLYSLGIVFYELLTGKKPFTADTTVDMFLKHVNEPPPRIGKLVNELPPKLEALILQLMEKDKDDRPTDAAWVGRLLAEIEDDAVALKSAGLDAVTSRRADKSRNLDGSRRDEADREAVRALRGKKPKKVKKKDAVPFFQRKAVQAAGLILALGAIAGGVYLALRPPSPGKLLAALDAASTTDDKLAAAVKYLEQYGDQPGEQTDKAAATFKELTTRKRDEVMNRRFASGLAKPADGDDPDAYALAWQAMEAEKAGQLGQAEGLWKQVRGRFPDEAKLPFALKDDVLARARWGWLADKRLADLRKVGQQAAALRKQVAEKRDYELEFPADPTSPEALAIRAVRLEDIGDRDKAGRVWDQLAALTEKEPDKREWYLLASHGRAGRGKIEDPVGFRRDLARKKLAEAETIAARIVDGDPDEKKNKAEVRVRCREVAELYADESDPAIAAAAQRAGELLRKWPKN
jgi:serine/threonine-protein kinase